VPERTINFASDNTSGVAPEVLTSISEAATSAAMPYGEDVFTKNLKRIANEIFEREVNIFPVVTGSAANALALATVAPPYGTIYCHEQSHIEEDECAAPEFYMGGGKLHLLAGAHGKITSKDLHSALDISSPAPAVHRSPPAVVSITQSTEIGSLYTMEEVSSISEVARSHGLPLHMDGARFANAIVALGKSPAEVTWRSGVDILSLGATKNGAFAAEAVVFFNQDLVKDFEFRRKRGGHLLSKYRFLSAQLLPYLESNRWLHMAGNANLRASQLEKGLRDIKSISILYKVETNMIFLEMPVEYVSHFYNNNCLFYSWGDGKDRVFARLVTSFDTTQEDVKAFLEIAHSVAASSEGNIK